MRKILVLLIFAVGLSAVLFIKGWKYEEII